jgi:hypothetical protein
MALALVSGASAARAGLFRAYLSAGGSDANPCTVTAPCRLLPAGLAAVDSGGEVWILDSANYNTSPVVISKSVTILAIPGAVGSLVATGGSDALQISGTGIEVALRNLVIVSLSSSSNGVNFLNGAELDIESCSIASMGGTGISVTAANSHVSVKSSVLRNNGDYGFYARATVVATLDDVQSVGNRIGVYADAGAKVNVGRSVLADNSSVGAFSFAGHSGATQLVVANSTITDNANALMVGAGPGGDASLVSDANVITFASDTVFAFEDAGGTETIWSRQNNTVGYFGLALISAGHALTTLNVI